MSRFALEINGQGYLVVPADVAAAHFPDDVCVAIRRAPELWLLPINGAASGGLLMKQRNANGDRSVLVWESLPPDWSPGIFGAFWDSAEGAMRIALPDA